MIKTATDASSPATNRQLSNSILSERYFYADDLLKMGLFPLLKPNLCMCEGEVSFLHIYLPLLLSSEDLS